MRTGFQQATYILKTGQPGNIPLDRDGKPCTQTGKQAIRLLKGEDENNPKYKNYEIEEPTFEVAEVVEGVPTRRRNTEHCPVDNKGHIKLSTNAVQLSVHETTIIKVDSSHAWRIVQVPPHLQISVWGSLTGNMDIAIRLMVPSAFTAIEFLNVVTGDIARLEIQER